MEEHVGALWHRLVTRLADNGYPEAAVRLRDLRPAIGLFFRALGGSSALQVESADASANAARRAWLQRLAGAGRRIELAWRDEQYLRLPGEIACFPAASLNRDLYFWLAALAVADEGTNGDWFAASQAHARRTLQQFPGLIPRYRKLVAAHIARRPDPAGLPRADAAAERAIRNALNGPGSVPQLPAARRPPAPVVLWLHPDPPRSAATTAAAEDAERAGNDAETRELDDMARRQAKRVEKPDEDRGLVTVRMENIFSWGEFVNVDRGQEDEEDLDKAESVARDLDELAVSRDSKASPARLRFDLDLPSEAEDDTVLDGDTLLPEWDWRRSELLPDRCRVVSMQAADAEPVPLPDHLRRPAKRLRNQFQALAPARRWHRARPDGQEIDLDAYLRYAADRAAGAGMVADGLYRELRSGARDLACLLLADLSLSTDTWIDNHSRVIDVIRDSLLLFAESLNATRDAFSMYGFSSRKRDPVRVHTLKTFDEPYNSTIRGRIVSIKPGYYTRLGAGIRHASDLLAAQGSKRRLLLVLSDGKPNDLDQYEGRYGIEDTRQAIITARRLGLQPFCVTIDTKGNDYLPYLFGTGGYVVIRHPAELPSRLPLLYARLTA